MAVELSPVDFAAAIGVKVGELAALERGGLPFINRKKDGHAYPLPAAVTWYVKHVIETRVGGLPPRTTQKELAMLTGYSSRQIANLAEKLIVHPLVEDGQRTYPIPAAVLEILAYREAQARGKPGEQLNALELARTRKANADAEISEHALLRERGETIPRVLAQRALGDLMQSLRSQLVQFAPRYEADLVGLDSRVKVRAVLKPAVNAEITRLGAAAAQVGRRLSLIDADAERDDEDDGEEGPDGVRSAS